MRKKYIFFDIDGTLTNHNPGGIILPSTYETLKKLKENGHFVAIATGRNYSMAKETLEISHIDNAVCCGGNGLIIDGKVRYIRPLDRKEALMLIHECLDKGILFAIMKDDSSNMYTHSLDFEQRCPNAAHIAKIHYIKNLNYDDFDEIHKIFIESDINNENTLDTLQTTRLNYARYHEDHIVVEPDDKYSGIVDMINEINGSLEDVVVFGDGRNDLSMMRQAATSIAMGNAIDELKEIADFITKDCNDDGIEYACQYYGWI